MPSKWTVLLTLAVTLSSVSALPTESSADLDTYSVPSIDISDANILPKLLQRALTQEQEQALEEKYREEEKAAQERYNLANSALGRATERDTDDATFKKSIDDFANAAKEAGAAMGKLRNTQDKINKDVPR